VVLVALSDGRLWQRLDPADYPATKQRLALHMVRRAEQLFPKLGDSIETAVVSTPITNMRYTGNPSGAIYGFANTPSESPGLRIDQRGPLEGLWFSGAWTQPGGSFQSCVSCGVQVAEAINGRVQALGRPPAVEQPAGRTRGAGD
jgi:prolycopene isomerase